jgi:cell division protease FtsH
LIWGEKIVLVEIGIGVATAVAIFLLLNGINALPFLVILIFSYIMFNIMDKGSLMKNHSKIIAANFKITFDKIGGQEVAKNELLEALDFIRNIEEIKKMGIRPIRGILLTGNPGTGKTLMAKAATTYIDSIFVSASGSEFVEMYAGVGAQRVRQLFESARQLARKESKKHGIIFIDEIEVIAGTRGKNTSHLEYDQTLNQLLVEMDGISANNEDVNILVIAATNRPDILDSAILRPGRFDRIVQVDLPDKEGRIQILNIHVKDKPLSNDVDLDRIAKETFGFSGAHIESLCNEAAILAMREGNKEISQKFFIEAIDKVIMGEKLARKPNKDEQKRIAVHESGHALVSELVNPNSVSAITITSRGQALGYMRQNTEDDLYLYTKRHLESQITVCLAGAVAEEQILGESSTGASSDLERAVDLAKKIIFSGMSPLGVVDKDTIPERDLHNEITNIINIRKQNAEKLIVQNADCINTMVHYLLEHEKVDGNWLREILSKAEVA